MADAARSVHAEQLRKSTAYHEAGHVVVAAVLRRPLSSDGARIDDIDRGFVCYAQRKPSGYCNRPNAGPKADTITAARAGYIAQCRFYADSPARCAAGDDDLIRKLLESVDPDDPPDLASDTAQYLLKFLAKLIVDSLWPVITEIAEALLAAPLRKRNHKICDPNWTDSSLERVVEGKDLQSILAKYSIPAEIWDDPAYRRVGDD